MKVVKGILIAMLTVLTLASCATISPSQIGYLGDATQTPEVVGKSTHWDLAGSGVTAKQYTQEYNAAIDDAFQNAPAGTQVLKNLKVFRTPNNFPQILGIGTMLAGSALITDSMASSNFNSYTLSGPAAGVGIFVFILGLGVSSINTYDLVIIGEPSAN